MYNKIIRGLMTKTFNVDKDLPIKVGKSTKYKFIYNDLIPEEVEVANKLTENLDMIQSMMDESTLVTIYLDGRFKVEKLTNIIVSDGNITFNYMGNLFSDSKHIIKANIMYLYERSYRFNDIYNGLIHAIKPMDYDIITLTK